MFLYRMPQKAGPLWKPSHVWLLIASFLRKSKTPENHLKASIAYSSTQEWILSSGFLGFSIYVKKNVAIKINYRGRPDFWGIRYVIGLAVSRFANSCLPNTRLCVLRVPRLCSTGSDRGRTWSRTETRRSVSIFMR